MPSAAGVPKRRMQFAVEKGENLYRSLPPSRVAVKSRFGNQDCAFSITPPASLLSVCLPRLYQDSPRLPRTRQLLGSASNISSCGGPKGNRTTPRLDLDQGGHCCAQRQPFCAGLEHRHTQSTPVSNDLADTESKQRFQLLSFPHNRKVEAKFAEVRPKAVHRQVLPRLLAMASIPTTQDRYHRACIRIHTRMQSPPRSQPEKLSKPSKETQQDCQAAFSRSTAEKGKTQPRLNPPRYTISHHISISSSVCSSS